MNVDSVETSPADSRRSGHARHPRPCPSCEAVLGFSSFPHGETERDRPRAVPVSRRDRTAQRVRRPGVSASGAHVPACPSAKKAACVPPCAAPGRGGVWGSEPGARGAEVVGAEALEWLPSERDKAPAREETPERQRPEGPSGHAALAAPRAPACVLAQAPHSGTERALATAHATSRAHLRQAVHREAHASQRSSCAAAPPTAGAGKRARPPAV